MFLFIFAVYCPASNVNYVKPPFAKTVQYSVNIMEGPLKLNFPEVN